jgi:hypothetical protein
MLRFAIEGEMFERHIEKELENYLGFMPATLITGASFLPLTMNSHFQMPGAILQGG